MRIKAVIAYDGRAYRGFQRQPHGGSVQDAIEKALSYLVGVKTAIRGAGRTDAGVSAKGQVVAFDVPSLPNGGDGFKYAFNRLLPTDIYCSSIEETSPSFDPRKDALGKFYSYRFSYLDRDPLMPFVSPIFAPHFDIGVYKSAIETYVGRHDFRNFTPKSSDRFDFSRIVYKADAKLNPDMTVTTSFIGDGFMTYMVRIMIGVAIKAACLKLTVNDIAMRLDSAERHILSFKAPAQGLMLEDVFYSETSLCRAIDSLTI